MAKKFKDLTPDEKQEICNGCGPKGGFKVPDFVFKESCDHHDYNYFLGYKEKHRKKADSQFYEAIKDQINNYQLYCKKTSGFWIYQVDKLDCLGMRIAGYIYYKSVRIGGSGSFHYGIKEQEF